MVALDKGAVFAIMWTTVGRFACGANMPDKPPFIASQSIWLLDSTVQDARSHLNSSGLRLPEETRDLSEKAERSNSHWKPVARNELFFSGSIGRLCLSTDAGVGKTTTLEWVEQAIGEHRPDAVALLLEMRQLPDTRKHYLESGANGAPPLLVDTFRIRGGLDMGEADCRRVLQTLIGQGRLTLLIDAIDQTFAEENVSQKLQELQKFLQHDVPRCPAVIAGRPYAVDRYWNDLFAQPGWRFAQLAPFSESEQKAYLGEERFSHLKRLDVEVLSVPRALETVRILKIDKLNELRTASDVYWRAVQTMLEKAFENREVRVAGFTIDSARWLLAVLAFEMVREGNFSGVTRTEMPDFRRRVWQRHKDACDWETLEEFRRQLRLLGKLNVFMDYAVSNDTELQQIHWKNRSLQEFFAGMWIAFYASEQDQQWLAENVYLPKVEATNSLEWTWRFAAEMPAEGRAPLRWVRSMAPLYAPGDGSAVGRGRSTEMLYRSWVTMEAYAEENSVAGDVARQLVADFQAEFPGIVDGRRGPEAQRVAEAFLAEFRPIPAAFESRESLRFTMGSPETEERRHGDETSYETSIADPFELACYQVTNGQYELFDAGHASRRDEYSGDDESPVLYVSWYDAWAFCRWLGDAYRLPSEKEWEFACRAGTATPFHFGESLSSEQANFDGNYPYSGATKGPYLERTSLVGSYDANAWGLFDMHGNVWEWCDTWFAASPAKSDAAGYVGSARVLRGGSWYYDARNARSANRIDGQPSVTDVFSGFRVARAKA